MELKTDSKHKKIDLRGLDLKKAKELGIKLGATTLTLMLLSGCGKKPDTEYVDTKEEVVQEYTVDEIPSEDIMEDVISVDEVDLETTQQVVEEKKEYNIVEHSDDELVDVDLYDVEFDDGRKVSSDKITYGDLKHVTKCFIIVNDSTDCDFLNYMYSLKEISISDLSSDSKFENVDGSRLPSGIKITISPSYDFGVTFNQERYGFLKDIESIDSLTIGKEVMPMNVDSDFLQSLRNVHNLCLFLDYNSNFFKWIFQVFVIIKIS